MFGNHTNVARAEAGWGGNVPEWVMTLAIACDRTNQRQAADRLGKSGGYVSRVLRREYAGSYEEAERLIRAKLGAESVDCPVFMTGEIPLASCLRQRRRKVARNEYERALARTCPTCPNNTDREED